MTFGLAAAQIAVHDSRARHALFGEVMGQLVELLAAGVLGPGQPTRYELADGPKALAELEARATVGELALLP